MFVRQKLQKSGKIIVQVIDKSSGRSKVIKTLVCSSDPELVKRYVQEDEGFIQKLQGQQVIDFTDIQESTSKFSQLLHRINW